MHDPFKLDDAVIRDLPHVRVTRHAPQEGKACEYRKIFKSTGLGGAAYWIQRENDFLLDFTVKRLRHTVELAAFAQGGESHQTPVVEWIATRDAGLTIEDWLRVRPRYENGEVWSHPFQHAGLFLQLLRACLLALREIHSLGIVHCDIKEDNICLPYSPYPYSAGRAIRIDFERIRLIDFAFSVTPERPLQQPLPILPTAPYQSSLLKAALGGDRSGKNRGRLAVQQLDFRADLYSLGFLAGRILDLGLLQPAGAGGAAAIDGARALVDRLQAFDGGKWRGKSLPHDELVDDIDGLLDELVDLDIYRRFEVAHLRETTLFAAELAGRRAGAGPTPLTPLAAPMPTPLAYPATPRPQRRFPTLWTLAVLAGLGVAGYWWQAVQPPAPQTSLETVPQTKAPAQVEADGAAKKRAKKEAQWRADAEAQFQAEEAKQKAEAEARAKAELAAELKAEVEAGKRTTETATPIKPPWQDASVTTARAIISHPAQGDSVARSEAIQGNLEGIADSQHAFLVIRSKAEEYGRLYYPQAELPHASAWTVKGVFGTPNYAYETFVVATGNPWSAELLRAQKSRAYGLKTLPEDTRVISEVVTVRRGE